VRYYEYYFREIPVNVYIKEVLITFILSITDLDGPFSVSPLFREQCMDCPLLVNKNSTHSSVYCRNAVASVKCIAAEKRTIAVPFILSIPLSPADASFPHSARKRAFPAYILVFD
jgi:hypothetical protein